MERERGAAQATPRNGLGRHMKAAHRALGRGGRRFSTNSSQSLYRQLRLHKIHPANCLSADTVFLRLGDAITHEFSSALAQLSSLFFSSYPVLLYSLLHGIDRVSNLLNKLAEHT